jgi:hypothetical protein
MTNQTEIIASLMNTLRRIAAADPNNTMFAALVIAEAREAVDAAETAKAEA